MPSYHNITTWMARLFCGYVLWKEALEDSNFWMGVFEVEFDEWALIAAAVATVLTVAVMLTAFRPTE